MPAASILVKPASSNCNIDCSYCFYKRLCKTREAYSHGRMSEETLEALIKNAMDYADGTVSFAFQGGEPMLAGLSFYRLAVSFQKKYAKKGLAIENAIQTNGTLIDDEWARFFAEENFLVGVSLDGPRKLHDACRKSAGGAGTFTQAMDGISLLAKYNVPTNIVTVITQEISHKASYLYKFYKRNDFEYIQVIPCMGNIWETGGDICAAENEFSVRPEDYGDFLSELFDLWYEDLIRGGNMQIRTFSNYAYLAAGLAAEECGMNGKCACYFAVEADGSVYPCDFYCTDEYRLGDVNEPFEALISSERAKEFVSGSEPLPEECRSCQYLRLCRGGCRHLRESGSHLNYFCKGYKAFFEHCAKRIDGLGRMVRLNSGR